MKEFALIIQVQLALGIHPDGIAGPETWKSIYEKIMNGQTQPENLAKTIKILQAHFGIAADGVPGHETWEAISGQIGHLEEVDQDEVTEEKVDPRSEVIISSLLPEVQPLARQLVHKAAADGVVIKVLSGYRSYEEQDALFAQGRTKPGPIITKAPAGFSNHNFAIAFDIGVFENGKYMGVSPSYAKVGPIGKSIGLAWGGDWQSIKDTPHYELRPDWAQGMSEANMLIGLRNRKARNTSVFI